MKGEQVLLSFLPKALTPWQKLSASQVPLGKAGCLPSVPSHFSGFLIIYKSLFTYSECFHQDNTVRACDELLSFYLVFPAGRGWRKAGDSMPQGRDTQETNLWQGHLPCKLTLQGKHYTPGRNVANQQLPILLFRSRLQKQPPSTGSTETLSHTTSLPKFPAAMTKWLQK